MISIRGARVHNLKNVSLDIPRNSLVVITGVSGSGKSSLAFDTVFAEGQRRYVESLSSYARQFLNQVTKPDVDEITGLSPTISIDQGTISHNPRSTVGTVTEIYDYLRVLFARVAVAHCYQCGSPVSAQSAQQITDDICALPSGTKLSLLAPVVRERKGEYHKELTQLRMKGFIRARIDGELFDLSDDIKLEKNKKHSIDVVVDRIILKGSDSRLRIQEAVETGLKLSNGSLILQTTNSNGQTNDRFVSNQFSCLKCDISYSQAEPRTFSFNSKIGQCEECEGLGIFLKDLSEQQAEDDYKPDELISQRIQSLENVAETCGTCAGTRLKKESLSYTLGEKNISDLTKLTLVQLNNFFSSLTLGTRQKLISERLIKEIKDRLIFLEKVGVGYLSLARAANTLSGGEMQRIRLATQLGSSLNGVVYVLDEPSIGLHQCDNDRLLETLRSLRDQGNSILVVEHDQDTMLASDYLIDLGPGAGKNGGWVIDSGPPEIVTKSGTGITAKYLRNEKIIPVPKTRRPTNPDRILKLSNINTNNLKNISLDISLGQLIAVTGISGSGKSSLVFDSLYPHLLSKVYGHEFNFSLAGSLSGQQPVEQLIDRVIDIDQSPIGRTPRSNPATYTGVFSFIREIFAQLPDAKSKGLGPGSFSFNVKGGRCELCQGGGQTKIEMHFLPDVWVTCEQCMGKRYQKEVLGITLKGLSISEILALSIEEALTFFENFPKILHRLQVLNDVGLGYIQLGQSATSLSGGEAQRMKLARELSRRPTGKTIYLLDEPTTGLHLDDIARLVQIFDRLVDQGNTVIVIEHQLDVIKCADYVVDVGPGAGENGGSIVVAGTPEQVAKSKQSLTGKYLSKYL